MKYLVRYSAEMTTKSRVVRTQFCRQLRKNLARLFRVHLQLTDKAADPHDPAAICVDSNWDNIQIELPPGRAELAPAVEAILANTPGVWSFNRVLAHEVGSFDQMLEQVLAVYRDRLRGRSFVVRDVDRAVECQRLVLEHAAQHPYTVASLPEPGIGRACRLDVNIAA